MPKTIDVNKKSFKDMDVDTLESLRGTFMDVQTYQNYREALENKNVEGAEKKAKIISGNPHTPKKKDRDDPPKAEDIIEAMYNNILIKYSYKTVKWAFDWTSDECEKIYRKRQNKLAAKEAKLEVKTSNTYKMGDAFNDLATKSIEKTQKECREFNDFVKVAEMIRDGRIDEIDDSMLDTKGKAFVKSLSPDDIQKYFGEKNIKEAQDQYLNDKRFTETFAAKAAAAMLIEKQMANGGKEFSKEEREAMFKEEFEAAKLACQRDLDNCMAFGIHPKDRAQHLNKLANDAHTTALKNLKDGNFNEMGKPGMFSRMKGNKERYRGNEALGDLYTDMKKAQDNFNRLSENEKVGFFDESLNRNMFDKMAGSATDNILKDESLTAAEKAKYQAHRDTFNKKVHGNRRDDDIPFYNPKDLQGR